MKAAFLTARKTMEVREVPKPSISADTDVLIAIKYVGVCGSDLHSFGEERVGSDVMEYPVVMGHECSGVVEAVGRLVTRVKPGDQVAIEPAVSCGRCDQCLAGRRNTCRKVSFMGHRHERSGALSEFVVMPEENCFPLGPGLDLVRAVLAEPFSIGLHAVHQSGQVEGKTMAVLGAGPIGLSVALAAKDAGVSKLFMTEIMEARRKAAAAQAGADWTGDPHTTDIVRDILGREQGGLDVVIDCTGEQEALDQAVELLKPGGTLVLVGIPIARRVSFDIGRMRRRELRLQNVRRQNMCMGPALEMIASGRVNVDFMPTHRFPLERAGEAFETALERRDGVVKALVTVG